MAEYDDLDLRLWKQSGRNFAQILRSPAGESTQVEFKLPFPSDKSFANLRLQLAYALLRSDGKTRGYKEERELRSFGTQLFNSVFTNLPEIAGLYARSRSRFDGLDASGGLRIKLRIESAELALLPWEYLFDSQVGGEGEFLCLLQNSPIVRSVPGDRPPPDLMVDGPLKILAMISNPEGDWEKLDTEKERRLIDQAIQPLHDAGKVHFRWVAGDTYDNLLETLEQEPWHVFHFIGHGGFKPAGEEESAKGPEEGFLVFRDERGGGREIPTRALKLLLNESSSLRLIVLNCCDGARGSPSDPFASLGAALVRSGIPAVVAMQFPITDAAAIQFAGKFYKGLTRNFPLEKAMTQARKGMVIESSLEWGVPVLFTRAPAGPLFRLKDGTPDGAVEPSGTADLATQQRLAMAKLRELFNR